jgi:hypothetical protein
VSVFPRPIKPRRLPFSPLGSAFQRLPLLSRWCGLLRPEQQQMERSQKRVAAMEKAVAIQVIARARVPRETLMS